MSVFVGIAAGISISIYNMNHLQHHYHTWESAHHHRPGTTQSLPQQPQHALHLHPVTGLAEWVAVVEPQPHPIPHTTTSLPLLPHLCSDGVTYGYDTWSSLLTLLRHANRPYDEGSEEYYDDHGRGWSFDNNKNDTADDYDSYYSYYHPTLDITICPGTQLWADAPLRINTPALVRLQCVDCRVVGRSLRLQSTLVELGPAARHVLVRGWTLATTHQRNWLRLDHPGGAVLQMESCVFASDNRVDDGTTSQDFLQGLRVHADNRVELHACQVQRRRWWWW